MLDQANECPICLAVVTEPVRTPCDHTFCTKCINAALNSSWEGRMHADADVSRPTGLGFCPICRAFIAASSLSEPMVTAQLWGCVFVQVGAGLGESFHFTEPGRSHIERAGEGSTRKSKTFVEASFDARQRCFRGSIVSSGRITDRQLEQRWEYTLHFGAGFATIERGNVCAFNSADELLSTKRVGADLQYVNRDVPEAVLCSRGPSDACSEGVRAGGAAAAMVGEDNAAAMRSWISESNPTLGEVLERLRRLTAVSAA